MILLNFTTALKYIIGLMLVMLGWIPYEANENSGTRNENPVKDTIFIRHLPDIHLIQENSNDQEAAMNVIKSGNHIYVGLVIYDTTNYMVFKQEPNTFKNYRYQDFNLTSCPNSSPF